ncbi:MAG: hypothetical protein JO368_06540, partial [Acidimicrobiales bacterium]|nr:hypothetical protein [Acidimicrobiales bacterium]
MPEDRDALLARLEELDAAFVETEASLRRARSGYKRYARRIAKGVPLEEVFDGLLPEERVSVNAQLDLLEQARHRVRLATVALGLDQGLSLGRLGRLMGVSRQLTGRIAREL